MAVEPRDPAGLFAPDYDSPQSDSSPQTPTEEQHSMILAAFNDYKPSAIINNDSEEDYITEDDLLAHDPAPSGRSSISSFPASVVHHEIGPNQSYNRGGLHTPSRSRTGTPTLHDLSYTPLSPHSTREYITGFRNPSSVRALQMRDEFSDSEDFTPGHRRRGSRMSYIGYRSGSTHSTPGKRLSRSLQGSPVKGTKLRKEFPLVLLHCSLLPGLIIPKAKTVSEDVLEAIIPEPYKKRWKTLREKVVKNSEVRDRGVLIPHPKDDYDLLEEKLLESLELETPMINNGHYVPRSESRASVADSGFGSEEASNFGDSDDRVKCADCGSKLCGERKWEVKVYAANGLMRAGAWGAAWSEMEKVDVEVSVWLPEDVRLEIEARLEAVIVQEQQMREDEKRIEAELPMDERKREIYGEPRRQEEIDGLTEVRSVSGGKSPNEPQQSRQEIQAVEIASPSAALKVDLPHALLNYIRLLARDGRNIAIVLLSVLVVFYAMANQRQTNNDQVIESAPPQAPEMLQETKIEYQYLTTTVVSTSTSIEIALHTDTVTETASVSVPSAVSSMTSEITSSNDEVTTSLADLDNTTETTDWIADSIHESMTIDTESLFSPSKPGETNIEHASQESSLLDTEPTPEDSQPESSEDTSDPEHARDEL